MHVVVMATIVVRDIRDFVSSKFCERVNDLNGSIFDQLSIGISIKTNYIL